MPTPTPTPAADVIPLGELASMNLNPPMGQPPMGQPPMGQPPMGQPPMGQPLGITSLAGNRPNETLLVEQDLDPNLQNMGDVNYGPITPTGYYIEEGNDYGMGTNILGPDASFAKQFPDSPMQPPLGGSLNGFSPAPQAPIRPGVMGGELYPNNPMSGPMADYFTQFPKITELDAAYRNFLTSGGYSPDQFSFQDFTNFAKQLGEVAIGNQTMQKPQPLPLGISQSFQPFGGELGGFTR
jgi:hypothetical protein